MTDLACLVLLLCFPVKFLASFGAVLINAVWASCFFYCDCCTWRPLKMLGYLLQSARKASNLTDDICAGAVCIHSRQNLFGSCCNFLSANFLHGLMLLQETFSPLHLSSLSELLTWATAIPFPLPYLPSVVVVVLVCPLDWVSQCFCFILT